MARPIPIVSQAFLSQVRKDAYELLVEEIKRPGSKFPNLRVSPDADLETLKILLDLLGCGDGFRKVVMTTLTHFPVGNA